MSNNPLRDRLDAGEIALGLHQAYPASGIIEAMCPGWNFVWIDVQHGQHDYHSVLHAIQVADRLGVGAVVRVPGQDPGILGRYADLAPAGIMVPMVQDAAEARAVVEALCFAPRGRRSFGGRRTGDVFGRGYYRECRLLVVAQIESSEAVGNVDSIAAVDGVDVLFYGPDDMRVDLGIDINTPVAEHAELVKGVEAVGRAAKAEGKACGMPVRGPDDAVVRAGQGYQLLACGSDAYYLRAGGTRTLGETQKALGQKPVSD
ncbi:MAG: hypothetical protein CMJ18_19470 [Phycisphaeraceae bacterium]|nr:hypothetical protein [Phycisphaeraceae bacterium]